MKYIRKITVFLLMARKVESDQTEDGYEYLINKWNPLVLVTTIIVALIGFFTTGFLTIKETFQAVYMEDY